MQFDETQYVEDFIKKHRGARTVPGDLMSRYAITLPATDAEISAKIRAVRAYWNKVYLGKSTAAQVAKMCRAEDERLRVKHGAAIETSAWWQQQQSARQLAAEASIKVVATDLRQHYGPLGVVTSGILDKFTAKLSLTRSQAVQAAESAGLRVITGVSLPDAEPIRNFTALLKSMSECGAASVPDLVHPNAGPFSIIDRYVCRDDPRKRLDATAVEVQTAEAEKRGISVSDNARLAALRILRRALRDGVDLRDVTLYHLVLIARDSPSTGIAAGEMQETGLESTEAAVIAVLVAEQNIAIGASGADKVTVLLTSGRLREARTAALSLPAESGMRLDATQQVDAAQQRLDALIAEARSAKQDADEARAALLLRDAAQISAEDADQELATVPLAPPTQMRAVCDGAAVKLFWRPGPGHDRDTVYAVCRTQQRPPTAPTDGVPVHHDKGGTCTDPHVPVARAVQYGVFALSDDRPSSRPATASVMLLPPVSQLEAEVGPDSIALHWSAHSEAEVRVIRTVPGAPPMLVPVNGNGCQLTGLAEGQAEHFEVTAIYRGPGGAELCSASEQISATPRAEARPVQKLRAHTVEADGAVRVRVSWTPVDNSEVRIIRSDSEPAWPFGTVISAEEMAGAGTEVTGRMISGRPDPGFETILPAGVHHLVPFSIGGTGIVVGRGATVAFTDPVRHLVATPFATHATVSWEWPLGAQLAEVSWGLDRSTDVVLISRAQYRSGGGVRVPLGRGPCEVKVRAGIMVGDALFTSPPVHAVINSVMAPAINYKVSSIRPFGARSKKVVFSCEQTCRDVRVRMVAFPGRVMPTSAANGIAILETMLVLEPNVPAERHVTIPRSVKQPFWVRCFVVEGQARLIDPPVSSLKET